MQTICTLTRRLIMRMINFHAKTRRKLLSAYRAVHPEQDGLVTNAQLSAYLRAQIVTLAEVVAFSEVTGIPVTSLKTMRNSLGLGRKRKTRHYEYRGQTYTLSELFEMHVPARGLTKKHFLTRIWNGETAESAFTRPLKRELKKMK